MTSSTNYLTVTIFRLNIVEIDFNELMVANDGATKTAEFLTHDP